MGMRGDEDEEQGAMRGYDAWWATMMVVLEMEWSNGKEWKGMKRSEEERRGRRGKERKGKRCIPLIFTLNVTPPPPRTAYTSRPRPSANSFTFVPSTTLMVIKPLAK
jgi:hypothetical protein